MKKLLSVFLAIIMIAAMIPVTSATETAENGAITFDFTYETFAARGVSGRQKIENKDSILSAFSTYPKNMETPSTAAGDQWIYLGMNGNYSGTATGNPWVRIDGSGYIITNTGSNIWPTSAVDGENVGEGYIAFMLYVPSAGTYDLTLTAGQSTASDKVDVYLGKAGSLNKDYFASAEVKGEITTITTGSVNEYTGNACDTKTNVLRKNAKKFSELGVPESYLMASDINLRKESAESTKLEGQLVADAPGDYILILQNKSTENSNVRLVLSGLTLTPAKLDKTHEYVLNRDVLTGAVAENEVFKENYRMFYKINAEDEQYLGNYLDTYDNVNASESDLWCISVLGGYINSSGYKYTSSLKSGYLEMVHRRRLNNSGNGDAHFVLSLNVKYDGIYNLITELGGYASGAEADIYMLPATEAVTEISPEALKNLRSIGRISNVEGKLDENVGAVSLTKGNWYIVFAFSSTNPNTATNNRQYMRVEKIILTETDKLDDWGATPETTEAVSPLNFTATANIPDAVVSVNGVPGNLQITAPERGASVNIAAPDVSGYRFIGWTCGTLNEEGSGELANTSKFVPGLLQTDDFTVYTSTFLTAIYEEETPSDDAEESVKFWNRDGSYLGSRTVSELQSLKEAGKSLKVSLIGHTFAGWFTEEDKELDISCITEKITHAVAAYTADATVDPSAYNGVRVNGELILEAAAYGDEVICEDNGEGKVTHWLRDGKVVSYDETYTHYVWDNTNITSSYAAIEKKPLIVLDSDTVSDAYMIEYDGAGRKIAEVGIIFGAGVPSVESKAEIFKSQRGQSHGQFAAKPSDGTYVARGYMIYEDTDGSYKVIYSE